jgi:hypothetical protein
MGPFVARAWDIFYGAVVLAYFAWLISLPVGGDVEGLHCRMHQPMNYG